MDSGGAAGSSEVDPHKVYVGSLPEDFGEAELREGLEKYGKVDKVWIARNPPGFAFVWFFDERDALDAVQALEGVEATVGGMNITWHLEIAKPRAASSRRDDDGFLRRAPRGNKKGPGGYRVKILNLSPGMDWREIKDTFRRSGEVTYADVRGDEGIAEFSSEEDRERAVRDFDGQLLRDRRIQVQKTQGSSAEHFARLRERYPGREEGGGADRERPRDDRRPFGEDGDDAARPPPRAAPPPPPPRRYDDRDERPYYRDYERSRSPYRRPPYDDFDDRRRAPPPSRYDDRYDDRGPPPPRRYDDRYDDRGPPPPPPPRGYHDRYDDRYDRYDDRYDYDRRR